MIEQIIKLLNSISEIQIISAYSEEELPRKPYATYTVISKKAKDFFGATEKKYDVSTNSYKEVGRYREVAKIQFDVYANKNFEKAQRLFELILFILRKEWRYIDTGIVSFSEIKNLREEIKNKYEYRTSFDVDFEYMNLTKERETLIAETIELIANDIKTTIKEEK